MGLEMQIASDLTAAMKARDALRVSVLRMLKTRLTEAAVAKRTKSGAGARLSEDDVLAALSAYAKQRRDAIEAYRSGGRDDLAAREADELAIVEAYLPAQLGDDELRALVDEALRETGAEGPRQMGDVMKALMPKVRGRADGKRVSAMVRAALG